MNFFFGGMMCGAMVASTVYESYGRRVAWACVGACPLGGALILAGVAAPTIKAALAGLEGGAKPGFLEPTKERLQMLQESNGMEVHAFLKKMKHSLEDTLRERNYTLWHGNMQRMVEKCIDDAFPELSPWDDQEIGPNGDRRAGFSFLQDVASLNVAHGNYEMVQHLEDKFQYDLHSHFDASEAFYNHHVHVDWNEYATFVEGNGKQVASEIFHRNRLAVATHN